VNFHYIKSYFPNRTESQLRGKVQRMKQNEEEDLEDFEDLDYFSDEEQEEEENSKIDIRDQEEMKSEQDSSDLSQSLSDTHSTPPLKFPPLPPPLIPWMKEMRIHQQPHLILILSSHSFKEFEVEPLDFDVGTGTTTSLKISITTLPPPPFLLEAPLKNGVPLAGASVLEPCHPSTSTYSFLLPNKVFLSGVTRKIWESAALFTELGEKATKEEKEQAQGLFGFEVLSFPIFQPPTVLKKISRS